MFKLILLVVFIPEEVAMISLLSATGESAITGEDVILDEDQLLINGVGSGWWVIETAVNTPEVIW